MARIYHLRSPGCTVQSAFGLRSSQRELGLCLEAALLPRSFLFERGLRERPLIQRQFFQRAPRRIFFESTAKKQKMAA